MEGSLCWKPRRRDGGVSSRGCAEQLCCVCSWISLPPSPALSPALTGSRAGGSAHGIAETADRERKRWRRLWTEEDSGGPPTRQRGPRLPGSQTAAARCPRTFSLPGRSTGPPRAACPGKRIDARAERRGRRASTQHLFVLCVCKCFHV